MPCYAFRIILDCSFMPATNIKTLCAADLCSSVAARDELPFGFVPVRCPYSLLGSGSGQPKFGSRSMVCLVTADILLLTSAIWAPALCFNARTQLFVAHAGQHLC